MLYLDVDLIVMAEPFHIKNAIRDNAGRLVRVSFIAFFSLALSFLPLLSSLSLSLSSHAYACITDWAACNFLADETSSSWQPVELRFPSLKETTVGHEENRYFVRSGALKHFSTDQMQTNAALQFVNYTDAGCELMHRWHQVA